MTIGNLESIVAKLRDDPPEPEPEPEVETEPERRRRRGRASGRHRPVSDSGRRRPVSASHKSLTGGRPVVSATSSFSAVDPSLTSTGFAHGVMNEQRQKSGAVITWLLVIVGLGGIGWIAYTMFTMK
jgi:hypothetical protein